MTVIIDKEDVDQRGRDFSMYIGAIFIILLWYSFGKAALNRPPESIADFVTVFVVVILIPVIYGYIVYRIKKPDWDRKKNRALLIADISKLAESDDYTCLYVKFDQWNSTYPAIYYSHKTRSTCDCYSFQKHGYANLSESEILSIMRSLESRLDGYLKIAYKEIGGYDPSVTVTHGTMPGGGDGYYVNVGGYDTANIPVAAYLYIGENAKKQRQFDKNSAKKKSSLKRI